MKYNHGSGMNLICEDKKKFNISLAKQKLNKWKYINYGLYIMKFIILDTYHNKISQIYSFTKPKNLNLMLRYAKLLYQEFVFVRVD